MNSAAADDVDSILNVYAQRRGFTRLPDSQMPDTPLYSTPHSPPQPHQHCSPLELLSLDSDKSELCSVAASWLAHCQNSCSSSSSSSSSEHQLLPLAQACAQLCQTDASGAGDYPVEVEIDQSQWSICVDYLTGQAQQASTAVAKTAWLRLAQLASRCCKPAATAVPHQQQLISTTHVDSSKLQVHRCTAVISRAAFQLDGITSSRVAAVLEGSSVLQVWPLPGSPAASSGSWQLLGHSATAAISGVCWHQQQLLCSSSATDSQVLLWELSSAAESSLVYSLCRYSIGPPGCPTFCLDVCRPSQGALFACGSADRSCRLFDFERSWPLRVLSGPHTDSIECVRFIVSSGSDDSSLLATSGCDGLIVLWDLRAALPCQILRIGDRLSGGVATCLDGNVPNFVAVGDDCGAVGMIDLRRIQQPDTTAFCLSGVTDVHTSMVSAVCLTTSGDADGECAVISGSLDGCAKLWSTSCDNGKLDIKQLLFDSRSFGGKAASLAGLGIGADCSLHLMLSG